jgi:RNA polymerase sigma factor (TIGR02999 family)
MANVTQILSQIEQGDPRATEQLLPLVYDELRKLAAARLACEKPGQTLQATALVHDAYIRLVDVEKAQQWNGRGHFFASAAEAMRRILVDRARHKATVKGGGQMKRVELADEGSELGESKLDVIALDEALRKLETDDPRRASVVKLRFFAGLTSGQAAEALEITRSTADADWAYAKCWLRVEMTGRGTDSGA